MADGDPMVLQTRFGGDLATGSNYHSLLENGPLERWANTAAAADGWTWDQTQSSTLARVAGARTSGVGSYIQRISTTGPALSLIGGYLQSVTLLGHPRHDAQGHLGMTFTATIWARETGAGTVSLTLRLAEKNAAGTILASTSSSPTTLTGSWAQITVSRTLDQTATAKLEINAILTATGAGDTVVELDEAELYAAYTFSRNPTMPDDQILEVPFRVLKRTQSGSLHRARPSTSVAKYEKRLRFGNVGITQFKMMRSLHLLDSSMLWTPNHPHLPALLEVRFEGPYNFRLKQRAGFDSNLYEGSLTLTET